MRWLQIIAALLVALFVVGSIVVGVYNMEATGPCIDRPCGEAR